MSQKLKDQMRPKGGEQRLQDRVAETMNLIHDFAPIQPTAKALEHHRKGLKYDVKVEGQAERDISMITNISPEMVFLAGIEKALAVTSPCEARTKFFEQLLRASRSKKGWAIDKSIEMMKAVRPHGEEEKARGKMRRFADWMKGSS